VFNSIAGRVTEKSADSICVETGGVEWSMTIPATDLGLFETGKNARVFTWLYHKEDAMKLYGFASEKRRATFLELLKVEGIGPRGAVKIMSGIDQEQLETALETEDLSRLEAVPGLGKKTAQKMLLALKGKLHFDSGGAKAAGVYGELAEALAGMGYEKRAAAEVLAQLEKTLDQKLGGKEREQELFRQAIVALSSGA
jgi:Holliday junction DNA helicase RuvA